VFEARAGVKLAEQSAEQTKQGVKQAEESSKQNRSLMIFTIVTIIFVGTSTNLRIQLPLSFISSIFGMNAPEFGQGAFHIWKQFLIMCELFHHLLQPSQLTDLSPSVNRDNFVLTCIGIE
jgi:Mg2+ and Co2+ transporter CorA